MTQTVLWPHSTFSPYDVLGVGADASVGEVRRRFRALALQTHPDKVRWGPQTEGAPNDGGAAAVSPHPFSFQEVREAAEILLDPQRRTLFDQQSTQAMIRSFGACSDSYVLWEDFEEVALRGEYDDRDETADSVVGGEGAVRLFQRECRCGGVYEVALFTDCPARKSVTCECDCCSLVVEVDLASVDGGDAVTW